MNFDLRFYWILFLRRLPYAILIVSVCTIAAVFYAFSLPPVYRAEARLLLERAQIPDELAASTVRESADENLLAIQQYITTRANLQELLTRIDMYDASELMTEDQMVDDVRNRLGIYMPPSQGSTGIIYVSFAAPTPELSATVANAVADQILAQNIQLRTAASGNTLDFFEQEVRRLSSELAAQNARILEFEEANRDALPESLEYRRSRQAALQERLLQVDRELASLRDRRQRLTDLYERTGRLAVGVGASTPEQTRLEELRGELASALVILSPTNPRVRALQTQVAALEETVKSQLDAEGGGTLSSFDVQMLDIDGQIQYLAEEKNMIETEFAAVTASIEATPGNSLTLSTLTNDYDNLRVQYDQAVASLADARMGDRIEVTDRGQRISIIEPALPPTYRSEPNRKLLAMTGFGAGVLLSAGLIVLLELLNRTIRRPAELVSALGITPFVTIPFIESKAAAKARRMRLIWTVLGVAIVGPLLIFGVLVSVMPMDVIVERVTELFGLSGIIDPSSANTSG
ncbi:lipopolysaccharide biosynthesis protein [Tabrizicola piscis]|uniref:Lipopolysaccharide biosynthesis protein n=1 Tax=Tabrizicola piscis TaxID=2494374 RepID=A0A3S8UA38_9RHOB|nr:Wzz/FepE/Etk N-terminal domain-containing protein [Tabrizicola piscis]AZL60487.1 lipopolysaccharide biosynthesis protein [Tabrizicola piscis]